MEYAAERMVASCVFASVQKNTRKGNYLGDASTIKI